MPLPSLRSILCVEILCVEIHKELQKLFDPGSGERQTQAHFFCDDDCSGWNVIDCHFTNVFEVLLSSLHR